MTDVTGFSSHQFIVAMLSGGCAGMAFDLAVFPIDAIKTRMQASNKDKDFVKAAENVSMFKGLPSAVAASFPCTAAFFIAYEYTKYLILKTAFLNDNLHYAVQLVIMASLGSLAESLARNPFEVVK